MSKFSVRKRFSLAFVSEQWSEAYIDFEAFSVKDVKERLSKLAEVEQEDQKQVATGLDQMVELLETKFVEGKAVDSAGKLVSLNKEDIQELPVEIIAKAVSFLSQGLANQS